MAENTKGNAAMMARGFKPVGWVAAVAGAALSCYMLSLRVASERAELAGIERQIIATKQNLRTLQTELGTRGRMAQLEQWNAEVLALAAPASAQFLDNEVTLARFDQGEKPIEERARVVMAAEVETQPKPREVPLIQASAPAQPKPNREVRLVEASAPVAQPRQVLVRKASFAPAEPKLKPLVKQASLTPAEHKAQPSAKRPSEPVAKPKPVLAATKARPEPATKAPAKPKPALAAKPKEVAPAKAKRAPVKQASLIDDKLAGEIGEAAKSERKSGEPGAR
jgi:hypothetical protein